MSINTSNSQTFLKGTLQTQDTAQALPLGAFLNPADKASVRTTSSAMQSLFPEQTASVVKTFQGNKAITKIQDDFFRILLDVKPTPDQISNWSKILRTHQDEINLPLFNHAMDNTTISHFIAKVDIPELIPVLAECGADFAIRENDLMFNNTPLIWAIANASNSTARQIIAYSNQRILNMQSIASGVLDNTALHLAVGKGHGNVNADGESLKYSNLDLVKELVEHGVNVNLKNRYGNTPLHLACIRHDYEMISYLLSHGAQTDILNNDGKSAKDLLTLSYEQADRLIDKQVHIYTSFRNIFDVSLKLCQLYFSCHEQGIRL